MACGGRVRRNVQVGSFCVLYHAELFRIHVPRILTASAMASGKVLTNPSSDVEPHIEFIHQVVEKMISVKEGCAEEDELKPWYKLVKMYYLGLPRSDGEPVRGGEQVNEST